MARKASNDSLVSMTTALYRYWEVLYLSFYRFRVYTEVIQHWRGIGWRYLVVMIAVFSIPYSIRVVSDLNQFIQERIVDVLAAVPTLEIQNGSLVFDHPMPYLARDVRGEVVAIVDTTGEVTSVVNPVYPNLSFLVTEHAIHFRAPIVSHYKLPFRRFEAPTRVVFPPGESLIMSGKELVKYTGYFRWGMLTSVYFMIISTASTFLMILFCCLAFVGKLWGRLFLKIKLSYRQSCRLIVVSSTPATLLLLVGLTLRWQAPWLGLMMMVMIAVYFYLGGLFYKRTSQQLVRT